MLDNIRGATESAESLLTPGRQRVKLRFRCVTYKPSPILICGDTPELGNWDLAEALPTHSVPRLQGGFECTAQIELPLGHTVEYKFVKKTTDGTHWESGMNRRITVIPDLHSVDADFRD